MFRKSIHYGLKFTSLKYENVPLWNQNKHVKSSWPERNIFRLCKSSERDVKSLVSILVLGFLQMVGMNGWTQVWSEEDNQSGTTLFHQRHFLFLWKLYRDRLPTFVWLSSILHTQTGHYYVCHYCSNSTYMLFFWSVLLLPLLRSS